MWHITDNGDVPPAFVLTNPDGEFEGGNRVALNPNEKEVILAGGTARDDLGFDVEAVGVYSFPEIFE